MIRPRSGNAVFDRLLDHSVLDARSGCWIWTGAYVINRSGQKYGKLEVDGRTRLAHREMFEQVRGYAMPKRKHGAHSCDVTLCICPDHLRAAKPGANQREAYRKGRKTLTGVVTRRRTRLDPRKTTPTIQRKT